MTDAAPRERYHHGDLPEVIMSLALAQIEAVGTEKLSLRALAREAGVSQTAPYRHFPTKRCLLAALATQGFELLHDQVARAIGGDESLAERFVQMGVAYVSFALRHPTHYHLMFGSVLDDFSAYEALHRAATEGFDQVQSLLAQMYAEEKSPEELAQISGVVWAGVHGMASLLLNGHRRVEGGAPSSPQLAVQAMAQDLEASIRLLYNSTFIPTDIPAD